MGNELMEENEYKEKEPEDFYSDNIRYGIISKKCGEKSLDDAYLLIPNLEPLEKTEKKEDYSLFGVFDGHNSDYVSKILSKNIQELYQKELGKISESTCDSKIKEIFKTMDKSLREEENQNENEINEDEKEKETKSEVIKKDDKKYINVDVDEKEINFFKDIIKNSTDIPDDVKQVEDSQIKDLILFKNLFKYNNNYLYNNNDVNYIGSSASIVLINDTSIFTADLGITTCILFNKKGEIKNKKDANGNTKDIHYLKNEHTFNSKEEKKRIKKFNKEIDYNNLKLNIYVPASRCFGLFKYKQDEILNPENQIISCVPEVYKYNKNDVDFILLMTKGMINLIGDNLTVLINQIVNKLNDDTIDKKEIKISQILEEFIKNQEIENEKKASDNTNNNNIADHINKLGINKANSNIYVGKEDFSEENAIINEINNNYYKDIINTVKSNNPDQFNKLNLTCLLIQVFKNKKLEEKKEKEKKDDNKTIDKKENIENKNEEKKEENKQNNIISKSEENRKNEEDKKEIKNDIKKEEGKEGNEKIKEKEDDNIKEDEKKDENELENKNLKIENDKIEEKGKNEEIKNKDEEKSKDEVKNKEEENIKEEVKNNEEEKDKEEVKSKDEEKNKDKEKSKEEEINKDEEKNKDKEKDKVEVEIKEEEKNNEKEKNKEEEKGKDEIKIKEEEINKDEQKNIEEVKIKEEEKINKDNNNEIQEMK